MIGIFESDGGTKKRTQNDLKDFMKKFTKESKQGLEDVWNKIYEDAVANCPVDTMSLVGTIRMVTDSSNPSSGSSQAIGGQGPTGYSITIFNGAITVGDEAVINPKNGIATSVYASIVHDGSIYVAGRPFLTDAFLKYEQELYDAVAQAGGP